MAATCHLTNLEDLLLKFWSVEEVATSRLKSAEEIGCEDYFEKTTSRDTQGRYAVRLPFREAEKRLGESRSIALRRLTALERKLDANISLKTE